MLLCTEVHPSSGVFHLIVDSLYLPNYFSHTLTVTANQFLDSTNILTVVIDPPTAPDETIHDTYKVRAPATVLYDSSYCRQNAFSLPPLETNGPIDYARCGGINTTVHQNTGVIWLNTASTGNLVICWNQAGCPNINGTQTVYIGDGTPTNLTYNQDTVCKGRDNTAFPTQPVAPDGIFFDASFGTSSLVIDSLTGVVDVSNTPVGSYTIEYAPNDPCKVNDTFHLTVQNVPNASFFYAKDTFCLGEQDPIPTPTSSQPGYYVPGVPGFSIPLPPAVIDSFGRVDLSATMAQNYSGTDYYMTHIIPGACSTQASSYITILDISADFALDNLVCLAVGGWVSADSIHPNAPGIFEITGPQGYYDTIPNPQANTSVDILDLNSISNGTYTVTYSLDTNLISCQASVTKTITVTGSNAIRVGYTPGQECQLSQFLYPDSVLYPSEEIHCYDPGLSYDANSGIIYPSQSIPGSYLIYQVTNNGYCVDTGFADTVVIVPAPQATFNYGINVVCMSDSNPLPSTTPIGGTYSVIGNSIPINPGTGELLLDQYLPNNVFTSHQVVYFPPPNSCTRPDTQTVQVKYFSAAFNYTNDSACKAQTFLTIQNSAFLAPQSPAPYFSFSALTSLGSLAIDSSQGNINPSLSVPGEYEVLYIVVDPHCPEQFTASHTVTIYESPDPSFIYPANICINGSDPLPSGIVTPGGEFFAIPDSTISIDPNTGITDLSMTEPDIYTIHYDLTRTGCPVGSQEVIEIHDTLLSVYNYIPDSVCDNSSSLVPVPGFGVTPGTFTQISGGNLDLNTSNGIIDPTGSDTGRYVIEHLAIAQCPIPFRDTLHIVPSENPEFRFQKAVYCETELVAYFHNAQSLPNGFYSSASPSLVINSATGEVDLMASDTGTYNVDFTPSGGLFCPPVWTTTITIRGYDHLTQMDYFPDSICRGEGVLAPFITGNDSGNFNSPGIIWEAPDQGLINIDLTAAGTYTIYYRLNTDCQEELRDTLVVLPYDDATFSYASTSFCANDTQPLPDVTTPGGFFTGKSQSLVIDSATGAIDLRASSLGPQMVYYQTNTRCTQIDSFALEIRNAPAPLSYDLSPSDTFCAGDTLSLRTFSAANVKLLHNSLEIQDFSTNYRLVSDGFVDGDTLTLVQTDASSCNDTTEIILTVYPIPNMDILEYSGNITSGEQSEIVMQADVEPAYFHFWSYAQGPVSAVPDAGIIGPFQSFDPTSLLLGLSSDSDIMPGKLVFFISPEANGCFGEEDSVVFHLNPANTDIFIPQAFTPNGDGINDTWQVQWVESIDPADYNLKVFNRSHGLVYQMAGLHSYWDGDGLPEGVYHWVLMNRAGEATRIGGLTLRRQ